MHVHSYSKEDFGYLVAFREGAIGLYSEEAASLCDRGADSDALAPYKLTRLEITPDFHLHAPLVIWLEVTSRCNLKCRHCFVSATSLGEPPADEFSTDQMLSLLNELKRQNVLCIVFTGGEPFVRSDFIRILEHATQLGFVIAVVSNGLRLTESLVKRIPKGDIRITISLDNLHLGEGDDPTNSRKFRYLQSRLLLLQRQGIACHAAATMTRKNLASLKTIFSWLTEQGIGYREIPFSAIGRGASCPDLQLTPAEVTGCAQLWAMSMTTERVLHAAQPKLTFDECYDFAFTLVYMARACKGARFLAYIAANGDVYPCTISVGTGTFKLGNVTETPFRDIWENAAEDFRRLSRWDNFTDCKNCALSSGDYFCTNRCPPMSLQRHGSPCSCGATPYDRASVAYRTKHLANLSGLINEPPSDHLERECKPAAMQLISPNRRGDHL
jgi:radical SAM protein with 4Fe4S-binding SPASM domain